MMLNLQFAETMELTEAELQEVSGGNILVNPGGGGGGGTALPIWGGGGIGPSPYGSFDWMKGLWIGLAERRRK